MAAADVGADEGGEGFVDAFGDRAGRAGELVAGDFAHTDHIAIGRRDKDFVGGVQIIRAKDLFLDGDAGVRGDFKKSATGDTFEAAGAERRRENGVALDHINVSGGTFSNFAAFVEQDNFVETFLLRFCDGPNVGQPGNRFYAGERRGGVASVFADSQADRLAVFGKGSGIDDEVDGRCGFIAAPEADLVVDKIDAGAAFGNAVGADDFLEVDANARRGIGNGHADEGCVFFEAAPVALIGEGFTLDDAESGEEAPAANEAGLSGRETDLLNGEEAVVMEDMAVDQGFSLMVRLVGWNGQYCSGSWEEWRDG